MSPNTCSFLLASSISLLLLAIWSSAEEGGDSGSLVARVDNQPIHCSTVSSRIRQHREPVESAIRRQGLLQILAAEAKLDEELERRWHRRRDRALIGQLEQTLDAQVELSPAEVRAYFDAHREEFKRAARISTRMIFRRLPAAAPEAEVEAARRQLESLRQEVLAGRAEFLDLAKRHSEAENASRGGAVAASPRGSLVAAYEAAAWQLEEGEISAVVQLPGGLAIILLERIFPASAPDFEAQRPVLEKRLRRQRSAARRQALLADLRKQSPVVLDWARALGPEPAKTPVKIGDRQLLLGDLDVRLHLPRRRQEVTAAIDRALLLQEAEVRFLPAMKTAFELDLLAQRARVGLGARLDAVLPAIPKAELEVLYRKGEHLLSTPETRRYRVLVVPAAGDQLRAAHDRALGLRQSWLAAGAMPTAPETRVEHWGPVTRSELDSATSPRFAKQIFALEKGQLSRPLRLEGYAADTIRFKGEGYLIAELLEIKPAALPPLEEVEGRVRRYAARDQLDQLAEALRAKLLAALEVEIDASAVERCLATLSPEPASGAS